MGGTDDSDPRDELSKWIDAQRAEISKFQAEVQGELSSWSDATSSPSATSSSTSTTADKGPFSRFKRFVDDNLSTIYTGLKHFPSNIAELKARMQEERTAREAEEREIWYRWTGTGDSPDHIRMSIDRATPDEREEARESVRMLLAEAATKNQHLSMEKMRALYADDEQAPGALDTFANPMLSFGGACYYKEESVDNLPSTARWGWPAPKPRWLSVDWFKRSPYSPVRLQEDPITADDGAVWRAAFEDLLCAALDKPMTLSDERFGQRYPYGKMQSTRFSPGLDWMLSLQCRGVLPPQLPSLYQKADPFGYLSSLHPRDEDARWRNNLPRKTLPLRPLASEIEELIDAVSTKSGPQSLWGRPRDTVYHEQMRHVGAGVEQQIEARHRQEIQQSRNPEEACPIAKLWSVPETEAELYDQFPPNLPPSELYSPVRQPRNASPATQTEYDENHDDDEDDDDDDDEEWDVQTGDMYGYVTEAEEDARLKDFEKRLAEMVRAERERTQTGAPLDANDKELAKRHAQRSLGQDTTPPTAESASTTPTPHSAILSQLTTTQTTRSPDGSVTTKVVLKQRFADGTEQEHESVHTSHENVVSRGGDGKEVQEAEKNGKKKGWFWT